MYQIIQSQHQTQKSQKFLEILEEFENRFRRSSFEFIIRPVPNSPEIAIKTSDNRIKIWSLDSGNVVRDYSGNWEFMDDFQFGNSQDEVLVYGGNYHIQSRKSKHEIEEMTSIHKEYINEIVIDHNGFLLGLASDDNNASISELNNSKSLTLEGHKDDVLDIAFSPDGQEIATSSKDETIRIWTIAGKFKKSYDGVHTSQVNSVEFSPDGKSLVTSSDDKSIGLISLETDDYSVLSHDYRVVKAAFSPDGQFVYSATYRDINIWSLDGQRLATYQRLGNTDFDFIDEDPTDDQYSLVTAGGYEPKIIEFDLKTLLTKGCQTAKNYLKHNDSVDTKDRKICDQFLDEQPTHQNPLLRLFRRKPATES